MKIIVVIKYYLFVYRENYFETNLKLCIQFIDFNDTLSEQLCTSHTHTHTQSHSNIFIEVILK